MKIASKSGSHIIFKTELSHCVLWDSVLKIGISLASHEPSVSRNLKRTCIFGSNYYKACSISYFNLLVCVWEYLKMRNVFHWSCLISTIFVFGSSGSNLNMTFHNNLKLFVTRPSPTVTTTKTVPIETPDHDATLKLWQKIHIQETLLRLELERTVKEMKEDFENMKNLQTQAKTEQNILNQQFVSNVTLLQIKNEQLKQVISNQSTAVSMQLNWSYKGITGFQYRFSIHFTFPSRSPKGNQVSEWKHEYSHSKFRNHTKQGQIPSNVYQCRHPSFSRKCFEYT